MNKITEAIVLAGGLGERLRHAVCDTQKAMAPVGGMPFLHYVLAGLKKSGVTRVVLAVSYFSEHIIRFFGEAYLGMELVYSREETPMGTGGAIKFALQKTKSDNVFLLNGDTFFDVDFSVLAERFLESGADIALSVKKMEKFSRYGRVEFDKSGGVTRFFEKTYTENGFINGGVYAIRKSVERYLPAYKCSFEKTVLEPLKLKEIAVESGGYFIDIGIPGDYFLSQTALPLYLGQNQFKAAFLDRDGVICREKHHLYRTEDFEFIENVPSALAKLRAMGYLLVVITNQAGVAKGLYTEEDVKALHGFMAEQLADRVMIDAVYYCPYHPDGTVEKYRRPSNDRKPNPGMIEKAVRDFKQKGIEIDLANSVLIGDTERDIETGINAGIGKKILVRSGHTIPDESQSQADAVADSLEEAVRICGQTGSGE